MNYGLYLSASGLMANSYRQDVFANNLANVETVGFKRDIPAIRQRDPEAVENKSGAEFSQRLLDKLGGGTLAGPQRISFTPSPLKAGNPLDVALETSGTFFAVNAKDASTGKTSVSLTRDGRFTTDSQNFLVTVAGNQKVLDTGDRPIQFSGAGPVEIASDGSVKQNGETLAQLQVTGVSSTDKLRKAGQNLFTWEGKADVRRPAKDTSVRPGFVESSGVDPVMALMDLLDATKATTANANMVRYHDQMLERAVNTLGRVA